MVKTNLRPSHVWSPLGASFALGEAPAEAPDLIDRILAHYAAREADCVHAPRAPHVS